MEILLKKEISKIGGWWALNNRIIVNNLGQGGLRVFNVDLGKIIPISDTLQFECGFNDTMLCSEFTTRSIKLCDYKGKILKEFHDIKYAYKSFYSKGNYFFLGFYTDFTDKKWFTYNLQDDEYHHRDDIRSETNIITSNCGVVWKKSHLEFTEILNFNANFCSIPIEALIESSRSTPLHFKYIGVGQRHLLVVNERAQRVILVNLEDGKILFNRKNCHLLNIGRKNPEIHLKNLKSTDVLSYSLEGELIYNFSTKEFIKSKKNSNFTIKVFNNRYFLFTPDNILRVFDKRKNLHFEFKIEELSNFSARKLLLPSSVKFSNIDLFGIRSGTDAFAPLKIYRIKY